MLGRAAELGRVGRSKVSFNGRGLPNKDANAGKSKRQQQTDRQKRQEGADEQCQTGQHRERPKTKTGETPALSFFSSLVFVSLSRLSIQPKTLCLPEAGWSTYGVMAGEGSKRLVEQLSQPGALQCTLLSYYVSHFLKASLPKSNFSPKQHRRECDEKRPGSPFAALDHSHGRIA